VQLFEFFSDYQPLLLHKGNVLSVTRQRPFLGMEPPPSPAAPYPPRAIRPAFAVFPLLRRTNISSDPNGPFFPVFSEAPFLLFTFLRADLAQPSLLFRPEQRLSLFFRILLVVPLLDLVFPSLTSKSGMLSPFSFPHSLEMSTPPCVVSKGQRDASYVFSLLYNKCLEVPSEFPPVASTLTYFLPIEPSKTVFHFCRRLEGFPLPAAGGLLFYGRLRTLRNVSPSNQIPFIQSIVRFLVVNPQVFS